ncbi:LOW QUALITY PROTEIN: hypothetical protein BC937DRAFT_89166 [Endogone sp. FLAS-F59071]|nr:LOW QUALITY PROTEIN: hypothetical protein BC937DRAFT_89166 [Endogone sp. FLAS-F59071]|eukprot:RUS18080.1 LOW QUALITY PROTEIN: hypothetical protein BC937DRAFT_89166 [Endogone sp. FLAS-F59071]
MLSIHPSRLDNTQATMVQFQAALAIKEIVVREYSLYKPEDITSLKHYLLNYCLQRPGVPKYLGLLHLFYLSAALDHPVHTSFTSILGHRHHYEAQLPRHFRCGEGDNVHECEGAIGDGATWGKVRLRDWYMIWELESFLTLPPRTADSRHCARQRSSGSVLEHQSVKRWTELGVSSQTHFLLRLFELTLTTLHKQLSYEQHAQDLATGGRGVTAPLENLLLRESVVLAEKILQWEFETAVDEGGRILAGTFAKQAIEEDEVFSAATRRSAAFPKTWRGVVANREVLWLFFTLYTLAQEDTVMSHRCRQCLIQLSGLKGELFESDHAAKEYAGIMMHGLLKLINNFSNKPVDDESAFEYGPHLLGITQMIRRLLENISLASLCAVPPFFQFLNEVAKISSTCLRDTITNEVEDEWSMEAFDECLETWVKLVDDTQSYTTHAGSTAAAQRKGSGGAAPGVAMAPFDVENLNQFLRGISYHVVETYIDTRLELAKFAVQNEEEEVEGGFKDWDTFADQLISIATLARLDPSKSLLQLQRLLNDRIERLKRFFETGIGDESDQILAFLHEHLNWLILITAHVLADSGAGEKPLVPDALMRLSVLQTASGVDNDQVVMISRTILGLLEFLSSFNANSVEASYCSPRVSETLFWFVKRWAKSYLLVDESEYGFMSPNIAKAFGKPSPSDGQGFQVLDFLIDRIRANFVLWNADPDVLVQMVQLLNSCARTTDLRNGLLRSGKFPALITFFTENIGQLPEIIHNSLVQCIATISTGASDSQVQANYFNLITDVIEKRLASVLHRPDFTQTYQTGEVLSQVQNAMEVCKFSHDLPMTIGTALGHPTDISKSQMFDGLALACETSNTTTIFSFCSRFFGSFVQLLSVYSSVPEVQLLILQFFSDLVQYLDFTELSEEQKQLLYNSVVELMKAYSAANLGKKRILTQEEEADEPYGDISTILGMLSSVMASEFEGYARNDPTPVKVPGTVNVSDVVFYGINIVIPLIELQMLKVPKLCSQYVRLISHLVEFFPDKLVGLPSLLFDNLMASLEFGIDHDIGEVSRLTLQAISPLALWSHNEEVRRGSDTVKHLQGPLNKFLQNIVELLLFKDFDSDLTEAASEALLSLICSQNAFYAQLATALVAQQAPALQPRLAQAFRTLDAATPKRLPEILFANREVTGFKEAMVAFLMDVRAVLRVK